MLIAMKIILTPINNSDINVNKTKNKKNLIDKIKVNNLKLLVIISLGLSSFSCILSLILLIISITKSGFKSHSLISSTIQGQIDKNLAKESDKISNFIDNNCQTSLASSNDNNNNNKEQKFCSYNQDSCILTIDWDKLNQIVDSYDGENIESIVISFTSKNNDRGEVKLKVENNGNTCDDYSHIYDCGLHKCNNYFYFPSNFISSTYDNKSDHIFGINGHSITELNTINFTKTGSAYLSDLTIAIYSNIGMMLEEKVVSNYKQ